MNAFADDILNVAKTVIKIVSDKVENIAGKWENAGHYNFIYI